MAELSPNLQKLDREGGSIRRPCPLTGTSNGQSTSEHTISDPAQILSISVKSSDSVQQKSSAKAV